MNHDKHNEPARVTTYLKGLGILLPCSLLFFLTISRISLMTYAIFLAIGLIVGIFVIRPDNHSWKAIGRWAWLVFCVMLMSKIIYINLG